jgi:hypothetical protein
MSAFGFIDDCPSEPRCRRTIEESQWASWVARYFESGVPVHEDVDLSLSPKRSEDRMQHIVLTRFNVAGTVGGKAPDEDWLKDRLDLFKKFTAPSLARQSELSFGWFIFIDIDSPLWMSEGIVEVAPGATLIPMSSWSKAGVIGAIQNVRVDEMILTTRVDNDDAVGRRFVEQVQEGASRATVGQFINLTFGWQLAAGRCYRTFDLSNPFISRIERYDDFGTVFATGHHRAWKHPAGIRQIRCSPMWMQVIHSRNVSNQLTGIRSGSRSVTDFDLEFTLAEDSRTSVMVEAMAGVCRLAGRTMRRLARLAKERVSRS